VSLNLEPIVRIQAPNNPCKIIFVFFCVKFHDGAMKEKGATKVLLRKKECDKVAIFQGEKKK
jgi:hypothetical protein